MTQHPWFFAIAIVIGLLTGGLLGAQPSVNGFLGRNVAHPLQASMISFATGTALLLVVTVLLGRFPPEFKVSPGSLPWWAWTGGIIGTVMVSTSLFFVPRIGSLAWFAVIMTGQIVASLVLDHYGLLGNPKQSPSFLRFLGAAFLVIGVLCITYSREKPVVKQRPDVADGGDDSASSSLHAIDQLAEHVGEEA